MIKLFNLRYLVALSTFLLIGAVLFVSASTGFLGSRQNDDVVIEYLSGNEPIKIVSLKVGDSKIQIGKSFSASDDWLKDLSVTIKNRYKKTVNYVEIGVIVVRPEEQKDQPPFHYVIRAGNRKKSLNREITEFELKSEPNNDETDLKLLTQEYADVRQSLDKLKYPTKIGKILIQFEEVGFTDGTIWSIGSWYKGDRNNHY